jgi:tetratricopeptide (TPR) repeat protein
LEIPPTVEVVVSARIDRLAPEDKRILQAAAVVGMDVPLTLLQEVADDSEDNVRLSLSRLQGGEFLHESRLFPDLEYRFKHALTRDVAYHSLVQDRRREVHARVVAGLELQNNASLGEHVEMLAHHAARGQLWQKAAVYCHDAGRRLSERSAYRQAAETLEQALEANSHLPEERATLERSLDVRLDLRVVLNAVGQGKRAFDHLIDAEALGRRLGDNGRLALLMIAMTHQLWLAGKTAEARRYGDMALKQAEASDRPAVKGHIYFIVGQAEEFWGEYEKAQEHVTRALELLGSDRDRANEAMISGGVVRAGTAIEVSARSILGGVHCEQGDFGMGVRIGEEALRIAESLKHPFSIGYAAMVLAAMYTVRGDFESAASLCERGIAQGGEAAIGFLLPWLSGFLGYAQLFLGAAEKGLPRIRRAVETQTAMGFRNYLSWFVGMLAEGLLLEGRYDDAHREAERALSLARECGERRCEASVHRLLGEIAVCRLPLSPEVAEAHYTEGLHLATHIRARPIAAECHLGLGALFRRRGNSDAAGAHIAGAVSMFREMGMTYWLEKAETEMAQLG